MSYRQPDVRTIVADLWDLLDKPPWVTIRVEHQSWSSCTYCFIDNAQTNGRSMAKIDHNKIWRRQDRETVNYVYGKLCDALAEVLRNTVAAGVGSLDVYRDD